MPTGKEVAVGPISMISRVSTESIPVADRVDFWEDHNRRALVGLTCSSYSERGLRASLTSLAFGGLRLADITGNEHTVERTPQTCRSLPKDSVFASLLLTGEAVFFNRHGCLPVTAGDLVLYDTRQPYLFGFSSPMHQLLIDIPREVFTARCLPGGVPAPMVLGRDSPQEGRIVALLQTVLGNLPTQLGVADGSQTETAVLDLVRSLAGERVGGAVAGPGQPTQLAMAKAYIAQHLGDPGLGAAQVAAAIGVSTRHLSRIFEPEGTSPSRRILEQRLAMAHDQLRDPARRDRTIAEVAHHWGFASQAHFTRVFRHRFGHTPGEIRP